MDSKYLKDLRNVLEAEATLARQGVDLLADPEYRALRELFIDGDMPIEEFVVRVEGLAAIRPDEDESESQTGILDGSPGDGNLSRTDDLDDLDDSDDLEDLQVLKDLRDLEGMDDSDPVVDDPDR